ncbi:MAG: tetratricopeptide repeat protein, partial [Rubrobacter sp.]
VRGVAISLFCLAAGSKWQGDFELAVELYEEALALCRQSGDPALLASLLIHLGHMFLLRGDLERATAVSEEAVAMHREQKLRSYLGDALNNLAWAALLRGDPEKARTLYEESLGYYRELGDGLGPLESLEGLACAAGIRGEAERAARLFGAAEILREVVGLQQDPGESALREPYLVAARSRLDEAAWEAAFAQGQAMNLEEAVACALEDWETRGLSASG